MADPIGALAGQMGINGYTTRPLIGGQGGGIDSPIRQVPVLPAADDGSATSFADTLVRSLNSVSDGQTRANDAISAYLRGDDVEVHAVVAAAEEAQLSLELLVQVRNKFIEAYRILSNMQG